MYIGELIKIYREEHKLSMQDFANISGISKAYIGLLEKIYNPTTGQPISPSVEKMHAIAKAIGLTTDELLLKLNDDQPITVKTTTDVNNIEITPKDEKHIAKILESMLDDVESGITFAATGGTVEEEVEKELFKKSLKEALIFAKKKAKEKYTPKKYRK